ncbi:MAG: 6,7-dimethyl-8-ribityllumazine synthase [Chthoniobacterales bacterium]
MSTEFPARPAAAPSSSDGTHGYGIVVSRYNTRFTSALADHARSELLAIDSEADVEVVEAPGAFEIPILVQLLAEKRRHRAILALGVIIRGETAHADLIAASITDALQAIALREGIPVVHEVLLVEGAEQAQARCLDPAMNRGVEAARTAVTVARTAAAIRES